MLIIDDYYTEGTRIVIDYVHQVYAQLFPFSLSNKIICVQHWNEDYPLTAPKRFNPNITADNIVFITCEDGYWSQIIYQLGHEFSHVVMDCYPENESLKWISECLCEAASIYMLDNSKSFFRKHLPIYEKSVEKYLYDHLNKSISLNACEIFKYIQKNIKNLTDDPNEEGKVGRPRNNIIGKYIASIILNNPEGWAAIALFPTDDEKMDYNEFVLQWYNKCKTNNQREFVSSLAKVIIEKNLV